MIDGVADGSFDVDVFGGVLVRALDKYAHDSWSGWLATRLGNIHGIVPR